MCYLQANWVDWFPDMHSSHYIRLIYQNDFHHDISNKLTQIKNVPRMKNIVNKNSSQINSHPVFLCLLASDKNESAIISRPQSRSSSDGRALDWRSKGLVFDPREWHIFIFNFWYHSIICFWFFKEKKFGKKKKKNKAFNFFRCNKYNLFYFVNFFYHFLVFIM